MAPFYRLIASNISFSNHFFIPLAASPPSLNCRVTVLRIFCWKWHFHVALDLLLICHEHENNKSSISIRHWLLKSLNERWFGARNKVASHKESLKHHPRAYCLESFNFKQPRTDSNVYLRAFIYSLYLKLLILDVAQRAGPECHSLSCYSTNVEFGVSSWSPKHLFSGLSPTWALLHLFYDYKEKEKCGEEKK